MTMCKFFFFTKDSLMNHIKLLKLVNEKTNFDLLTAFILFLPKTGLIRYVQSFWDYSSSISQPGNTFFEHGYYHDLPELRWRLYGNQMT